MFIPKKDIGCQNPPSVERILDSEKDSGVVDVDFFSGKVGSEDQD